MIIQIIGLKNNERRRVVMDLSSKDDVGKIAVGIFFLLTAVGIAYGSCVANNARDYLGHWRCSPCGDSFRLTELPSNYKRPVKVAPLQDGRKAKLLLPVLARKVSSCWHGRVGGIYRVDGHDVLIIWCGGADENVVTALSKTGDQLKLGLIDPFSSLQGQMCTGHSSRHSRYRPRKWLVYKKAQ